MMDYETLQIEHVDAAYIKVRCERSAAMELSEYFTFMVPGARHMPSFKNKIWDGKIRLFNLKNNTIYAGLRQQIEEFAKERGYKIEYLSDFALTEFSAIEAKEFYTSLNLPEQIATRDYQLDTFAYCVRNGRVLIESPTASGKSLMIYMLTRFYNRKTLIAVPTTALVHQMYSDFEEYGFNSGKNVHKIFAGQDKDTNKQVVVSTWQSIYNMDKKWFDQFEHVIGDECLHPDSYINMAGGYKKKIVDVEVGDLVMTFNEISHKIESKPVIKVHHNISVREQMYEVKMTNGVSIKITGNHKVLLVTGKWKRVDELDIGDIINSIEHVRP